MTLTRKIGLLLLATLFGYMPLNAQFRSLLKKANKEYELKAFNLAIGTYRSALARRPDNTEALANLADCYRHLNDMERAEEHYRKAVYDPRGGYETARRRDAEPIYVFNYAKTLKALGKYQEARKWFLEYAKSDPVAGNHYAQSCTFAEGQLMGPSPYVVALEPVNTIASEFGAAMFGDQVIFASARKDIKRSSSDWANRAYNQLFLAGIDQTTGALKSPVFLKRSSDASYNEGPISFTPDLEEVAYTKNDFVDGTRHIASSGMKLDIFIARVSPYGEWINPEPFPHNGKDYSTGWPAYSPDGDRMYFASDRPDGFGGYDIYVSYKTGNGWSTPENLGPVINSPGNEVSPFYDGQTLFFSSDYHQGMGGYDVFRGEQSNDRFIRIVHLGSQVNSPRDDYNFIFDSFKNNGYLTSNRAEGAGSEDIYRVSKSGDGIVIRVRNAADGEPITGAVIDFSDCNRGIYQTDANGIYSFQAAAGVDCEIQITKDDYVASNLKISAFGVQRNQSYEVTMSRVGEAFLGKVVSYATRLPLSNITVIAKNQDTGSYMETKTDQQGQYNLALSPNATYWIRYSAPGYRDINRTLQTADDSDRSILGVISILPSNIEGPIVEPVNPDAAVEVRSGYAVQIAAISQPDLSRFSDLEALGQVYYREEGSLYKVRLGVFDSRGQAEEALARARALGYDGSFMVEERGGRVQVTPPDEPETPESGEPQSAIGDYKIQLGAYRSTSSFDDRGVSSLGVIEDFPVRNLTVKLLAGFTTEEAAKSALSKVQQMGFRDAFVVKEENGKLNRIR